MMEKTIPKLITEYNSYNQKEKIKTLFTRLNDKISDVDSHSESLISQLIGEAPEDFNTLKELSDKIIVLQAIMNDSDPDADNIVNTVAELLAVFSTYQEGVDLAGLLTGKVSKSDVYNALDCMIAGKVADARQLKVLKDMHDALVLVVGNKVDNIENHRLITPSEISKVEYLDNTKDIEKSVSAQQAAADAVVLSSANSHAADLMAQILGGAPEDANTLKELNDKIIAIQSPFLGSAEPDFIPAGIGKAFWIAVKPGTYTHHGNVVVAVNEIAFIIRDAAGVFTISKTAFDFSAYQKKSDVQSVVDVSNTTDAITGRAVVNWGIENNTPFLKEELSTVKNLFNKLDVIQGYMNSATAVINGTTGDSYLSNYIKISPNTAYYLSGRTSTSTTVIATYDINKLLLPPLWASYSHPTLNGTFTPSASAYYVRFNWRLTGSGSDSALQLELGTVATVYAVFAKKLTNYYSKSEADLLIANKVSSSDVFENVIGKNKFNKASSVDGFYVNTSDGVLKVSGTSSISVVKSVIASTIYRISGRSASSGARAGIVFYNSAGTKLKPYSVAGVELATFDTGLANNSFMSPPTAVSVQFTISFADGLVIYKDTLQFELGSVATTYEAYYENTFFIKTKIPTLDYELPLKTISLKTTPTLLMSGASFAECFGSLKDKSFVSYMSKLVDWNFESFSDSGTYHLSTSNTILSDASRNGLKVSDLSGGKVIIALGGNEASFYVNSIDASYFRDNVIRLCENYKTYGFEPILCSYYGSQTYQYLRILRDVANEYGYLFIDIEGMGTRFNSPRHLPWWYAGHYGNRTQHTQWYNLLKALKPIEKPKSAIKVFRNAVSETVLNNLLFDDAFQKLKKWNEISVGHKRLKIGSEKYADRLDKASNSNIDYTFSEYNILRNSGTIAIQDKALIQIVLPVVGKSITDVSFNLTTSQAVKVYARRRLGDDLKIDLSSNNAGFVLDVAQSVNVGNIYLDSRNTGVEFTVVSYSNKLLVCSANATWVTQGLQKGTLTEKNGNTPTPITYNELNSVAGSGYFLQAKKPKGTFEEIIAVNGKYPIATIVKYLAYDTIDFLIETTSATNISNVSLNYKGGLDKVTERTNAIKSLSLNTNSKTQILTKTTFENSVTNWGLINNSGKATEWNGVVNYTDVNSNPVASSHIPTYYADKGVTKLMRIYPSDELKQTFTITQNSGESNNLKLRIIARFYPAENLDENNLNAEARTYTTFDLAKLNINVSFGIENYTKTIYVPLSFVEIEEDIYIESVSQAATITLSVEDNNVEFLKAEIFI